MTQLWEPKSPHFLLDPKGRPSPMQSHLGIVCTWESRVRVRISTHEDGAALQEGDVPHGSGAPDFKGLACNVS